MRFGAGHGVPAWSSCSRSAPASARACSSTACSCPNTELGHLEIDGHDAETRAAASARDREACRGGTGPKRVQRYLEPVVALFSPELIIVGGGASRKADKWVRYLDVGVEIVPATLENEAGIVGAALVGSMAEPPT